MTFTIPNVFIAGKKAVALEVNENFNAIKNELNRQNATISTVNETAEQTRNYVNDELKIELETLIKTSKAFFCVNSAQVDANGNADLLAIDSISPMRVTFKVGSGLEENLPTVVYSNYKGDQTTRVSLTPVDMTGKADGTYNILGKFQVRPMP